MCAGSGSRAFSGELPVFPFFEYNNDRYSGGTQKDASSGSSHRVDDVDLPVYFLLLETASAIMTAQESRLGNRDYRTKIRSFGAMASALFVQSIRRSNALYDALESRCYDGTIRVLSQEQPVKKKEIMWIVFLKACFY